MMKPVQSDKARRRKDLHRAESYERGLRCERWAGWLMRAKGFDICKRRYKAKGGEIDLVCRQGDLLVFLEVKFRDRAEDALYSITARNQSRIVAAATDYIAHNEDETISTYRFDVIVFANRQGLVPFWQHIESAFEAC
ncbi:YraN family protein [uncultured Cohaesibacter sp.]|uniref:YraN family protein n=1 Tax=uncultured Cohaesibacter sp. TaxID=1002546 RepID=UPI00292FB665|nr:YraN family protein [uncultured Cohaesibacter sp.]